MADFADANPPYTLSLERAAVDNQPMPAERSLTQEQRSIVLTPFGSGGLSCFIVAYCLLWF